jgi:hypothetical protein
MTNDELKIGAISRQLSALGEKEPGLLAAGCDS